VGELAEIVIEATGSDSRIEYRELPTDDPKVRRPDITKARQRLGWEPRVAVRDGVTRTASYFRALLEAEVPARRA
jgi:nucleoside-diphosphate-sugar epimerase